MAQKKLVRFNELQHFSNVLQYPEDIAGKWCRFFQNNHEITLELACGKGEYTLGLAALFPGKNFIGVDVKGNRLWKGAKTALQQGLNNTGFLRTQIDKINTYFTQDEVSEIWITFPDPQLRLSKIKKRLTHPKFLRLYQQFLKADGVIHLKTDSPDLYAFTKKVINLYQLTLINDIADVYTTEVNEILSIKTYYEGLDIAKSNKVFYLAFTLDKQLPLHLDETLKDSFREKADGR